MDSFFLSETVKYLFLLFDPENWISQSDAFVLTTEAHFIPVFSSPSAGSSSCSAVPRPAPSSFISPLTALHSDPGGPVSQLVLTGEVAVSSPRLQGGSLAGILGMIGRLSVESILGTSGRPLVAVSAADSGCPPDGAALVPGRVLIVRRGGCSFIEKTYFAQKRGAAALIVVNDRAEPLFTMSADRGFAHDPSEVVIPSILISEADGDRLERALKSDNDLFVNLDFKAGG